MIVADTSALIAVLFNEPEYGPFMAVIRDARRVFVSAGTFVELHMVVRGKGGEVGGRHLEALLERHPMIEIVPVDEDQARVAAEGFVKFGKGRHPAGLNLGDLFAYALARTRRLPLLFKGADFALTDVTPALPR